MSSNVFSKAQWQKFPSWLKQMWWTQTKQGTLPPSQALLELINLELQRQQQAEVA